VPAVDVPEAVVAVVAVVMARRASMPIRLNSLANRQG
jgi:hypothetical protein